MADIESEEFNDTCVRGFHVYKDVWRPMIGEELRCQREEDNPRYPYVVAVTKSHTGVVGVEVVGHVQVVDHRDPVISGHVAPSYESIQEVP